MMIVEEDSAAPYIEGVQRAGIEADHREMCKFGSVESPGYEVVAEALIRYTQEAPDRISQRWIEETGKALTSSSFDPSLISLGTDDPVDPPSLQPPKRRLTHKTPVVAPPGFHPNWIFVGMQDELSILHDQLSISKEHQRHPKSVLISGVTGSGKSHLARQYVWTHVDDYPGGIFWIDAESYPSLCKCYWDIAQKVDLVNNSAGSGDPKSDDECVEAVRNWFQAKEGWLLIFDGVYFYQDRDIDYLKECLPSNDNCAIIYTSVDKTLARRQRLFEPYCLTTSPLNKADGRKLLFKDLSIRRPTKKQKRRADELVEHFEGLPLALHATSHRLKQSFMPMEKYHVDELLTDGKLAGAFMPLMHDLFRTYRFEAINLINILSFLGHHIPVNLITMGRSALEEFDVQILSSDRLGERPDLDATLATLIKYGLIERIVDSRGDSLDPSQSSRRTDSLSPTESGSQEGSFSSTDSNNSMIDIVKIHSVVQKFCRDEITLMDNENMARGVRGTTIYDSWLVAVTRFFCRAYENAKSRMHHSQNIGLVQDYREFSIHGCKLLSHFPKRLTSRSPPAVCLALKDLREVLRSIHDQIDATSLNSPSQEETQDRKSIFDPSSSPSASNPDSPVCPASSPRLRTTWDSDVMESNVTEPWQDDTDCLLSRDDLNLKPFPPQIGRVKAETEANNVAEESTILSPPSSSHSQTNLSTTTVGWQIPSHASHQAVGFSRAPGHKSSLPSEISTSAPTTPVMTETFAKGVLKEPSNQPEARKVLANIQKSSPTQSELYGSTTGAGSHHSSWTKKSMVTERVGNSAVSSRDPSPWRDPYAYSSSTSRPVTQPPYESLCGSQPFVRAPSHGSCTSCSDSNYEPFLQDKLYGLGLSSSSVPVSRCPSRDSVSEALIEPTGSAPIIVPPRNSNDVSRKTSPSARTPALTPGPTTSLSPPTHPSAIMPGSSPSSLGEPPLTYMSEPSPDLPQSEPMSRGPSGQSQPAWSTEFSQHHYHRPMLPLSSNQHIIPQHHLLSEMGGWINKDPLAGGHSPLKHVSNNQENEYPSATGKSSALPAARTKLFQH